MKNPCIVGGFLCLKHPTFATYALLTKKVVFFALMQLDYSLLLENIKSRRYDEATRAHVLSPAFEDQQLATCVRYALEAMQEVDTAYAYKVYANTRRIHEHISKELMVRNIKAQVRYQGALRTETHIRLYGEVDMLFVMEENASHKDVFLLGQVLREIVTKQNHHTVDYSDGVRIRILTQKPVCRINLIPCAWINNAQYTETRHEIYRGIVVYNFKDKTRKKHLPFLNMGRISSKDMVTEGGYKRVIRLLKSLSTDLSIALNSYELTSLIYHMPDEQLMADRYHELSILPHVSKYIGGLVTDKQAFELLLSPSDKELVFGNRPAKRDVVKKLHTALDGLLTDLREQVGSDLAREIRYAGEQPIMQAK